MAQSWVIEQHAAAPIEAVWALLVDARSWSQWGRVPIARLEREGSPEPDGVGAIRKFGAPPIWSREEVVEFVAPTRFAYELRSGMPVVGYRAVVDLAADADGRGTNITWSSSFERVKIPGTTAVMRGFLRGFIVDTAKRLARAAEAR